MENKQQPQQKPNQLMTILTVVGSLGAVGGGGLFVNSNIDSLGHDLTAKIAVIENNVSHIKGEQEKISQKFVDDFKSHVNDPSIHANGLAKLKSELQNYIRERIVESKNDLKESNSKQWEVLSDIKDRLVKIEARLDSSIGGNQ